MPFNLFNRFIPSFKRPQSQNSSRNSDPTARRNPREQEAHRERHRRREGVSLAQLPRVRRPSNNASASASRLPRVSQRPTPSSSRRAQELPTSLPSAQPNTRAPNVEFPIGAAPVQAPLNVPPGVFPEELHPDLGNTVEEGEHGAQGPHVTELDPSAQTSSGAPTEIDATVMRPAAKCAVGVFRGVQYPWNLMYEAIRRGGGGDHPTDPHLRFRSFDGVRRCGRCGSPGHTSRHCSLEERGFVLKIFNCRFCGTTLLGSEVHGICCGSSSKKLGVSFKRDFNDRDLERMYSLRSFHTLSAHLNTMFATTATFMDMKYTRGGGPSFLKIQGNVSLAVPTRNVRYSYLWSDGPPSTNADDYTASFTRRIVSNPNIRAFVPRLYQILQPRPHIARSRYGALFSSSNTPGTTPYGNAVEISTEVAQEGTIVRNYQGTHEATIQVNAGSGPLPEDGNGRPLTTRAFVVEPNGLFRDVAPVAVLQGGHDVHHAGPSSSGAAASSSSTRVVRYRYMKPDVSLAERGAFPLLYPLGNQQEPYDVATFIETRDAGNRSSSRVDHKSLTWAEFTKRRLYTDNILLNSGVLLQQWVLRTHINIEDIRLRYLETEQMRLVEERELAEGDHTGHDSLPGRLFLPSNHKNSPAYWKKKRLDVQALVSKYGPPTLFITITMNVWREEMKRLGFDTDHTGAFTPQGSRPRPFDRPDIIARVYNQFANTMLRDLENNSEDIFGLKCVAIAGKLEFQERNTPHHHVLLWLEGGVIEDPEVIDDIIKAEIPRGTSESDLALKALVKRFNIHRHSPYCRGRTANGRCRFGYDEMVVQDETTLDLTTNRVNYRRRHTQDLKVVPYNKYLTKTYKAHINVERTQGGSAISYLMKYAFKPNKTIETTVITRPQQGEGSSNELRLENEIRAYMRCRVIGSVEACWNLFEFRSVRIHPTVDTLDLHLRGQRVLLIRNTRLPPGMKPSTLERYFKRPSRYSHMSYMTYYESVKLYEKLPRSLASTNVIQDRATPPKYVVDRSSHSDRMVTRIRTVSPNNAELFSLRLLLMDRPFSSFADAKVVGSHDYGTYREAAVALGLYAQGDEFQVAFDEAVQVMRTPGELRCMLVTMYQQGGDPGMAMEKHKSYLYSDIVNGSTADRVKELFRRVIQISDRHGGKLLRQHRYFTAAAEELGMSTRTEMDREVRRVTERNERSDRSSSRLDERYNSLNSGQKSAFDTIYDAVRQRSQYSSDQRRQRDAKVFFLQGHAGTGKTYLLSLLRDRVEKDRNIVKMTATTGIAASLYEGGSTLHSLLGIGVDDSRDSSTTSERPKLSKYGPRSQRAQMLRKMMLLIVDEASMMARVLFEVMDTILKDLRETRAYFAGVVVVFAGDYMQLLPVVPAIRKEMEDGQERVIPVNLLDHLPWYSSELWKDKVSVLRLTRQVRQASDPDFAKTLLALGKGTYPRNRPLPLQSTHKPKEAYKFLWKWVSSKEAKDVRLDRLLVAPTNSLVDEHNEKAMEMFPGRAFHLSSATSIQRVRNGNNALSDGVLLPEMTYNYCPTGVPPHMLTLKKGVPVMVIRNVLHPDLVNGQMFVVSGHTRRCLIINKIDTEGRTLSKHILHRIDFQFSFSDVKVTRRQFPVRVAFAATVHKSQGQTLKKVVVDFRTNFFSPGQVYVGLSRVRHSSHVLLLHLEDDDTPIVQRSIHPMPFPVKNPVLKEAIEFVEGSR